MSFSSMYLITGVFFQEQVGTHLGYDAHGEINFFLQGGIGHFLYTGVLEQDPHHLLGGYKGSMLDELGHAHLRNIVIGDTELRFEKHYENGRPHSTPINYIFRRENDQQWIGEYALVGTDVKGPSRCILQPITADFFRHSLIPQRAEPISLTDELLRSGLIRVVEE